MNSTHDSKNTDSESRMLWRKTDGTASIFITEAGAIGIEVGGIARVMPAERWFSISEFYSDGYHKGVEDTMKRVSEYARQATKNLLESKNLFGVE